MLRTPLMIGMVGIGASCLLTGCEWFYNGGFGLKRDDPKTVAAYQKAMRARQRQQDAATQAAATPAQGGGATGLQRAPLGALDPWASHGSSPLGPDPSGTAVSSGHFVKLGHRRPWTRQMGLYGRLGRHGDNDGQMAWRASPLSGPDNVRQITMSGQGADFDPDIDPTGKWLAFASTMHRETADIYLKRADGSAVTQLTSDPANDVMPAFSPDGKRITFASDRAGNWDIYLTDRSGGRPVQLTHSPTDDLHPSFSPDGKWLVYCSYGARSGQWELVVIEVESPATRRFIGYGLFPNWAPRGNRILFQRARGRPPHLFSLWTIDLVDGEAMRPTQIAAATDAAVITPDWSPDGEYVVFCAVPGPNITTGSDPNQADVWVMGADGRGRINLTHNGFFNTQPVWSRDGRIYFASNRGMGGIENIWSLDPQRALMAAQSVGSVSSAEGSDRSGARSTMSRTKSAPPTTPPVAATESPPGPGAPSADIVVKPQTSAPGAASASVTEPRDLDWPWTVDEGENPSADLRGAMVPID